MKLRQHFKTPILLVVNLLPTLPPSGANPPPPPPTHQPTPHPPLPHLPPHLTLNLPPTPTHIYIIYIYIIYISFFLSDSIVTDGGSSRSGDQAFMNICILLTMTLPMGSVVHGFWWTAKVFWSLIFIGYAPSPHQTKAHNISYNIW